MRRMTRNDWVTAARDILVHSGVEEVKVDRVARKARVTRGGFYWHFKNRDALLEALLRDWEARNHLEIAQVRARWALTAPELDEIIAMWLSEEPSFQAFSVAVRNWAAKSRTVADVMHRIDEEWISLLKHLFDRSGYDAVDSLVRARVAHFHQVGYHALALRESIDVRIDLAPRYYKILTGRDASESLLALLESIRTQASPKRTETTRDARRARPSSPRIKKVRHHG